MSKSGTAFATRVVCGLRCAAKIRLKQPWKVGVGSVLSADVH